MASSFNIAGRIIGDGEPPLIIAEIAQAHDGSLGTAHAYIDAVADSGAEAIKFQTHIAAAESTPGEPWRVRFSRQDSSRYAYWKRMEFSLEQWRDLKAHAEARGLIFLSSPFSVEAVELLESIGMPAWKIGSGETSNIPLLMRLQRTGLPILLSSGMSSWSELDVTVERITSPFAVMQCTSKYPCPPEALGLNCLQQLRDRYRVPVGFSDHSGSPFASIGAATLGANVLEVHVVFDRRCFGPDTSSSITIDELASLVQGTKVIHAALVNPVDKDSMSKDLYPMKQMFQKSVVLRIDAPAEYLIRREDLATKKPGTGIPAAELDRIIGRKLKHPVARDMPLREEDLDGAHK